MRSECRYPAPGIEWQSTNRSAAFRPRCAFGRSDSPPNDGADKSAWICSRPSTFFLSGRGFSRTGCLTSCAFGRASTGWSFRHSSGSNRPLRTKNRGSSLMRRSNASHGGKLPMGSSVPPHANASIPQRLRPTLWLLLEGARNRAIASRLSLAPHTVENYVSELLDLFECESRAEFIVLLTRRQRIRAE